MLQQTVKILPCTRCSKYRGPYNSAACARVSTKEYGRLLSIRSALEQSARHFPVRSCGIAAFVVKIVNNWPMVGGYVPGSNAPHVWNERPRSGDYADITYDQFPGFNERIVIEPPDSLKWCKDEAITRKVNELGNETFRRELFRRMGGDMKLEYVPSSFSAPEVLIQALQGSMGPPEIPYSYDLWL